ncbi:MAG: molecular chaperone TorD family protein [Lentisphaerae bacterium]|nr:molecular chaperone TorD family protein [Lentisphaerota bacterium]
MLAAPSDRVLLADAAALGLLDAGWETRIEDLQVEYTRLFAAPGLDAIPVHQSVYTDVLRIEPAAAEALDDGIKFSGGEFHGYLGGESCGELRRWYAAYGFEPPATEMPDHIAVELDFLAHLLDAQAAAMETGAADQAGAWGALAREFFERFPQRWLDAFAGKVAANAVSVFYGRVGAYLQDAALC